LRGPAVPFNLASLTCSYHQVCKMVVGKHVKSGIRNLSVWRQSDAGELGLLWLGFSLVSGCTSQYIYEHWFAFGILYSIVCILICGMKRVVCGQAPSCRKDCFSG
jgi:hypothetical protein